MSVQPVMTTLVHGRVMPVLSGAVLSAMQSSPETILQPRMRTLDDQSMSRPSLLGIRRLLSMRRSAIRTSSQPSTRTVQKAPLRIVTSRNVTCWQARKTTV